jgi:selenocysteine lyase/cysteine desulfurase
MLETDRRTLLAAGLIAATATGAKPMGARAAPAPTTDLAALARDEAYWAKVAAFYDRPKDVIQLEAGQFGSMPRPVLLAYEQKLERVNREGTLYTRTTLPADQRAVRQKIAAMLGVEAGEIAFTRGGTESMQVLIGGYNRLKPGDAVLYADLDYDSMQTAMDWLGKRRGVRVVKIALPEPATRQGLIDAYEAAFRANPDVRMALVTHLSHRTGLIPPIKEIAEVARAHDVDLLLDGGHALGQAEFRLPDLGVDFIGLNLHKWIQAPLGVGVVYIKRARLAEIDPSMFEPEGTTIDARAHTGTVNNGAILAVADAIDFHQSIGLPAKAHRLRYLRDLWAERLRDDPRVQVLTPNDPALHAGITSFRIKDRGGPADVLALKKALYDRYKVFTVERFGPAKGACIRVSPSFINRPEDLDVLVKAVSELARA